MPIRDWFKRRPKEGEETRRQPRATGDVLGMVIGEDRALPPGAYATYRNMRANPTIALARAVATAPILAADYSVEADDEHEERRAAVSAMLDPLWPFLVRSMLRALDYGWQPFEKVWMIDGHQRLAYQKLKPLLPELTEIQVDEHGAFAGLKQGDVQLRPEKCLVFTYDGEAGNLYGRARHENCRKEWHSWDALAKKQAKYNTKISAVVPIIEYPEGESRDKSGSTTDNYKLAEKVLASLGSGSGVAMPNVLARHALDLARSGVEIKDLKAWHIEFLETRGAHGQSFVAQLKHLESLMLRGWLVPERAATEGQYGTKAEAGTHVEVALVIADELYRDIVRHVNWYVVDPLLAYNWGPEAVGSVHVEPIGLDRAQQAFYRLLVEKAFGAPQNLEMALEYLDFAAMVKALGLPHQEASTEEAARLAEEAYRAAYNAEGEQ